MILVNSREVCGWGEWGGGDKAWPMCVTMHAFANLIFI